MCGWGYLPRATTDLRDTRAGSQSAGAAPAARRRNPPTRAPAAVLAAAAGVDRAMSQPPQGAGPGATLDGLQRDLMGAAVDRLTPVDVARLALTCRSLREATTDMAPATARVRATPGAAA